MFFDHAHKTNTRDKFKETSRRILGATVFILICGSTAAVWGQIPGLARSGDTMAASGQGQSAPSVLQAPQSTPVARETAAPSTISSSEQKELVHTILSTLSDEEESMPAVFVRDREKPESLSPVAGTTTEKNGTAPVPVTPYTGAHSRQNSGPMLLTLLNDIATPSQDKGKSASPRKVRTRTHSADETGDSPSFFSGMHKQKNSGNRSQLMRRRPLAELLKDDQSTEPKVTATPTETTAAKPALQPSKPKIKSAVKPKEFARAEVQSVPVPALGKIEPIQVDSADDPILGSLVAENEEKRPASLKAEKAGDEAGLQAADLSAVTLRDDPKPLASESDRIAENVAKSLTPVIEIKAAGPKRLMVGQEAGYTLHVRNASEVPANGLIVTTAIPQGIEILAIQPTIGTSRISETPESASLTACLWKLGMLPPGQEETLELKFIPRVRSNIDFVSEYDYEKSVIKSGIEVQEPVLELTVDGRDTIDWGVEDKYRMQIRNTGNGEAKNVRLTVATGENDSATRVLDQLAPGEEKTMEINIKTVLDGKLLVKVDAAADYGFSASTQKSIEILRGNLDIFVEAPEMQFVNDTVDYLVHVSNTGRAILQDVEVAAAIPSTVEYLSCSGDGVMDGVENRVVWKIPMIKPDEEFVYQVTAKMLRAGASLMEVTAADKTGVVSNGEAQVQIEAIAALEMKINKPSGPVALGTEVEYEIVIANTGTKAAEEIDAGFFLPSGMTPLTVEGGGVIAEDGAKVMFSKINFLGPGQSVAYKVRATAERGGNHKVQAVLESRPDDIQLVTEEMNYFYQRRTVAKRNASSTEMVAMKPKAPTSSVAPTPLIAPAAPAAPLPQPAGAPEKPAAEPISETPTDLAPETEELPFPVIPLSLPGPEAAE